MKVKAISLWQPWASLIAMGAKKYETRSWSTSYRGTLLICAAKGGLPQKELQSLILSPGFYEAFYGFFGSKFISGDFDTGWRSWIDQLPFGKVVAIVDLTKCTKTENCFPKQMQGALPFGDFSPGRYAWKLENIRAIDPFSVKGRQGLFEVEIDPCILEVPAV